MCMFGKGVVFHHDFAGERCPETAMRMCGVKLEQRYGFCPEDGKWFFEYRCCDLDPTCQSIAMEGRNPPAHYFSSLFGRLPQHHQVALASMRPDEGILAGIEEITGVRPKQVTKVHHKQFRDYSISAYHDQDVYFPFPQFGRPRNKHAYMRASVHAFGCAFVHSHDFSR